MAAYPVEKWILEQMEHDETVHICDIGEDTFAANSYIAFLGSVLNVFQRNFESSTVVTFAESQSQQEKVAEAWFDRRLLIQALQSLSQNYVKVSLFEDGEKQFSVDFSTPWSHSLVKGLDGNQMDEDVKTLCETIVSSQKMGNDNG